MVGAETRKEWAERKKQELADEYNARVLTGEIDEKELQEYLGLARSSYIRYRDECKSRKMISSEIGHATKTVTLAWIEELDRRFLEAVPGERLHELEDWFHEFHHLVSVFRNNMGLWSRDYAKLTKVLSLVAWIVNNFQPQTDYYAAEMQGTLARMKHIWESENNKQPKEKDVDDV